MKLTNSVTLDLHPVILSSYSIYGVSNSMTLKRQRKVKYHVKNIVKKIDMPRAHQLYVTVLHRRCSQCLQEYNDE